MLILTPLANTVSRSPRVWLCALTCAACGGGVGDEFAFGADLGGVDTSRIVILCASLSAIISSYECARLRTSLVRAMGSQCWMVIGALAILVVTACTALGTAVGWAAAPERLQTLSWPLLAAAVAGSARWAALITAVVALGLRPVVSAALALLLGWILPSTLPALGCLAPALARIAETGGAQTSAAILADTSAVLAFTAMAILVGRRFTETS